MKYLKTLIVVCAVISLAVPAFAKSDNAAAQVNQKSAGEKIADHTADAVADVLTGEDSSAAAKTKKVPPGQAKKGTVPQGWSKGEKTGWDKKAEDSGTKTESPIKQFVKKLFGQDKK